MSAPITVVGSLNMDFVVQVEKLPLPGETVLGGGFATIPGGKGANQAMAAARLGGRVRMVGRVGDDVFGRQLKDNLASAGVDTGAVLATGGTPSGVALIFVQVGGQNQIVVASGANARLLAEDVVPALEGAAGGLPPPPAGVADGDDREGGVARATAGHDGRARPRPGPAALRRAPGERRRPHPERERGDGPARAARGDGLARGRARGGARAPRRGDRGRSS